MSELHRGVQGLVLEGRVGMVDGQSCVFKRRFGGPGQRWTMGMNTLTSFEQSIHKISERTTVTHIYSLKKPCGLPGRLLLGNTRVPGV